MIKKRISHLVQICAQIEKLSKLILSIKISAKASYIMYSYTQKLLGGWGLSPAKLTLSCLPS